MPDQLDWSHYGSLWQYKPGDFVFREGDPGDSLFVIKTGRLVVLKNSNGADPLVLGYRGGEGRLLGEVSLIQGLPRTATIQAVEPTELYVISRSTFWEKFDDDPGFRRLLLDTLVTHLLVADQGRIDAAATQRALAEVIRLRQEMTNFIIHDLQNPLNIILTAVSETQATPGYDPDNEAGEMIEAAGRAVERMLRLVSSLLDTERLSDSGAQLDITTFNICDLIREIVERSQPVASHKAVRVLALPAEDPLRVGADRLRIDRVLTNLVDNALKFTPMNGQITISAQRAADALQVSVNDTGPGIPPENRDQVFLRFVQGEAGAKSQRGFGLGLAFCHAAITAHGGKIWVEQGQGGVGSCFVFSLPLGWDVPGAVQ